MWLIVFVNVSNVLKLLKDKHQSAIKLPHVNLSTFHTILNIYHHDTKYIDYFVILCCYVDKLKKL